VEWLTCSDICVARYHDLQLAVNTDTHLRFTGAEPPPPLPIDLRIDAEGSTLRLVWEGANDGIQPDTLRFFSTYWGFVEPSAPQSWEKTGGTITGKIRRGAVATNRLEGLIVVTENGEPIAGYEVDSEIRESTG
jgi:hypothetical protein